jgi:RND family efflux transporter MFP subunit
MDSDERHWIQAPSPAPLVGKPETRRRSIGGALFATGTVLLLVGGLAFGIERHHAQHLDAVAAARQETSFVPDVRVAAVRSSGDTISVTLPATTEAYQMANVYARASGYIDKRFVDIGSRVEAGQPLADISAPELVHQRTLAEANLTQTEANLRQAQSNEELARVTNLRTAQLTGEGWATRQQGDTDRLTYDARRDATAVAEANIAAQQAQVQVLRQQTDYLQVVAPFRGVVTQRNVDVGSLVQADATSGTFMFTVMNSDVLRIQLYVPQDAAFGLKPGIEAVVHVPEMPDRVFRGTVTRIADALQPDTRTLLTEIDVPNPDGALSPGVYCTVELRIPRKTPSLIVAGDALIFDSSGLHVAVVENGVAHFRPIAETRDLGTEIEVAAGVKSGDQVILNPPVDLTDGARVKVRPQVIAAKNTGAG